MMRQIKADLLRISPKRNPLFTFVIEFLKPSPFKAILAYRLANYFSFHHMPLISLFFEALIKIRYASDIRRTAKIGGGISFPHPYGIVIGGNAVVGKNCHIGQHVTIGGNMGKEEDGRTQPIIGDNCYICANSVVVGPIIIGNNVIIGAGSVVTKSIPDNVIIAGNPCKILKVRR